MLTGYLLSVTGRGNVIFMNCFHLINYTNELCFSTFVVLHGKDRFKVWVIMIINQNVFGINLKC